MKIKSLEETSRNYAISTIIGVYKFKEHWKKQGFNEESSIDKALNYAVGQILSSGLTPQNAKRYAEVFRELANISNALADMIDTGSSITDDMKN